MSLVDPSRAAACRDMAREAMVKLDTVAAMLMDQAPTTAREAKQAADQAMLLTLKLNAHLEHGAPLG